MRIRGIKDRLYHKLIERTNPYLGAIRRRIGGIDYGFSVISNNCWAGSVYRWFNLPYMTPTAGLYFFAEDYLEFLRNLKEYCSREIVEIKLEESRHREQLIAKGQQNVPIGKIGDVEIVFLHYPTFDEAKKKWKRRCSRICWDKIIVKNAEMNDCSPDLIKEFDKLPFKTKFVFTTRDYGVQSQVIFKEYLNRDQVKDDTTLFNKYINLTNLIKGKPFKRNQ